MRILVSPDKFKSSLTALEAAEAISKGFLSVFPDAQIDMQPLADGGEGTVTTIVDVLNGVLMECPSHDALGRKIMANFGWMKDSRTAVVEVADASGYWRIAAEDRNPLQSSTFGTGELIMAACRLGAQRILVGLGGSATNDAGIGIAAALGYQFLDQDKKIIDPVPANFTRIQHVTRPESPIGAVFEVLSDVNNPLLGAQGATRIFGPQKGANANDLNALETALTHVSSVIERDLNVRVRDKAGSGAAGGVGFGMMAFCGASLRSGFDVIADLTSLEERVMACDLIVTAEGSLDRQTLHGKGPGSLALMAKRYGKRVIGIGGRVEDETALEEVFDRVVPLSQKRIPLAESIARGKELLGIAARRVAMLEASKTL